jgi:hypothetical protein
MTENRVMKGMLLSVGFISLMSSIAFAQDAPAPQTQAPSAPTVQPSSLQLPSGNGVWAALVRRSGGIAGVSLTVTVNSEKKLNCTSCQKELTRTLSETEFRSTIPSFSFEIAPIPDDLPRAQANSTPISFCMDCFSTHITIQRRNDEGKIETYAATWNDLTTGSAPAEFVKLANTILALAK